MREKISPESTAAMTDRPVFGSAVLGLYRIPANALELNLNVGADYAPRANCLLPQAFAASVAVIAISWGELEHKLTRLIRALSAANGTPVPVKKAIHEKGIAKRIRFQSAIDQYFGTFPQVLQFCSGIAGEWKQLGSLRNLLLHGELVLASQFRNDQPPILTIEITRPMADGSDETVEFDGEKLMRLADDIAKLGGIVELFFNTGLLAMTARQHGLSAMDMARIRDLRLDDIPTTFIDLTK